MRKHTKYTIGLGLPKAYTHVPVCAQWGPLAPFAPALSFSFSARRQPRHTHPAYVGAGNVDGELRGKLSVESQGEFPKPFMVCMWSMYVEDGEGMSFILQGDLQYDLPMCMGMLVALIPVRTYVRRLLLSRFLVIGSLYPSMCSAAMGVPSRTWAS